jgi:hypothetical protein
MKQSGPILGKKKFPSQDLYAIDSTNEHYNDNVDTNKM